MDQIFAGLNIAEVTILENSHSRSWGPHLILLDEFSMYTSKFETGTLQIKNPFVISLASDLEFWAYIGFKYRASVQQSLEQERRLGLNANHYYLTASSQVVKFFSRKVQWVCASNGLMTCYELWEEGGWWGRELLPPRSLQSAAAAHHHHPHQASLLLLPRSPARHQQHHAPVDCILHLWRLWPLCRHCWALSVVWPFSKPCKTFLHPRPSFPFIPSTYVLFLNFLHMNLFLCRQLYVGFWRKQEVKAIDPNDAMDNL